MDYYISFGSNINPECNLQAMLHELAAHPLLQILKVSNFHHTKPWGKTDQPAFINGALHLVSNLAPASLLEILQQVEIKLGRKRIEKWGPRTVDLDIIWVEEHHRPIVINENNLQIPHPYFWQRNFVLIPLAEIYPHFTFQNISIQQRIEILQELD